MVTALNPKQVVSFEELLMSQVVQKEALTRLLEGSKWRRFFIVDKPYKNMLSSEMAGPFRRRKGFFGRWIWSYPGSRKPLPLAVDECANFWPACPEFSGGCRPAWALVSATGFARGAPHYRVGGLRGREIGELFQVGDRSVSQERRSLRDRLSDDRRA
jgi:hypothetical protein